MLGHGALGIWALGQLPQQAADALAPGAALPLYLSLVAGAASGEGERPAIIIGRPLRYHAEAPGAVLHLSLRLAAGGVSTEAGVRGAVLRIGAAIAAGNAAGEGQTEYDNDLVLLLAA